MSNRISLRVYSLFKSALIMLVLIFGVSDSHAENENLNSGKMPSAVVQGLNKIQNSTFKSNRFLIFHYDENKLWVFENPQNPQVLKVYMVSGGRGGISNQVGSGGTPAGLHRVTSKIGSGSAMYQTFNAPKLGFPNTVLRPTHGLEFWGYDFITSRVLRLEGLEPQLNSNSVARAILVHGTQEEGLIGYHESLGCIRMYNQDVMELFGELEVGTLLYVAHESVRAVRVPKEKRIQFHVSERPELTKPR